VVEQQSRGVTLRLTDTLDEQHLLETLIDDTKPPVPEAAAGLHYLLVTPFRYGPYPHASRFRRAGMSAGVFYGAEVSDTAIAEIVFYRLLFFNESPATPWPSRAIDFRAFAADFNARLSIDLTAAPFSDRRAHWTHPCDYSACLALADLARDAGIEVIRYQSVRDPQGRANLALLTSSILARDQQFREETWLLHFSPGGVRAICENPRKQLSFDRLSFVGDPRTEGWRWER
jgi:hypothetical protein